MEDKSKKFRDFFDKSFALRILSLLCAILLWFYVSAVESPTSEKTIGNVSITTRNVDVLTMDTGLSVVSNPNYETNIVLSGKRSTLNKISSDDISATIDFSKLTEAGTHDLPVIVNAPAGTTVLSVNPKYITVTIDKTVAMPFEIEPEVYYNTTYEIGDVSITDTQGKVITSVTVSGPATDVERIDKVVATIDFGTITSSVQGKTNLVCLDINGEEISGTSINLTPKSVIIKQPVYITKTLPLTASQANNTFADSQITLRVNPSSVEVKGDPKILEELDEIKLDPINEKTVIGEALTNTVNSLIKLPEGLELVGTQNTATITVNVKNVNKQYISATPKKINVVNMPSNMKISFEDTSWSFLVINSGDKEFDLSDLKLELNLASYTSSGTYTVNLNPQFKDNISYAYFPSDMRYSVTFELTKKAGE